MNNNFKKYFFSSLLTALVIVGNLVGLKYTSFGDIIVSASFVVMPITYLCVLLIDNYTDRSETYNACASAFLSQLFVLFCYVLVVSFSTQSYFGDLHVAINKVFSINETFIITSLIAFLVSVCALRYIYEYFRIIGLDLLGLALSLLCANLIYGVITIPVLNYSNGIDIIVSLLLGHILTSGIMTIVTGLLYLVLKEKDSLYDDKKIFVNSAKYGKKTNNLTVDQVINIDKVGKSVNRKEENSLDKGFVNRDKDNKNRKNSNNNKNNNKKQGKRKKKTEKVFYVG